MEIILYSSSMKRNLNFVLIAVIFTLILTIIIFSYNDIDLAFADVTVLEALDYEYVIIGTEAKESSNFNTIYFFLIVSI